MRPIKQRVVEKPKNGNPSPAGKPRLSKAARAVLSAVQDFHEAGVFDAITVREFNRMVLTPVHTMQAADIRELREKVGVSQAVFADILNVSTETVGSWERGLKHPNGATLKMLALVQAKGIDYIL